jgi:hypothetical protein
VQNLQQPRQVAETGDVPVVRAYQDLPTEQIARKQDNGGLVCVLDEVRIYNRALSVSEKKTLYEHEKPRN